jgi:DNA-binding NtrC family response regulator
MKLGAYDYITKPFDMDQLLRTVHKPGNDQAPPRTPRAPPPHRPRVRHRPHCRPPSDDARSLRNHQSGGP